MEKSRNNLFYKVFVVATSVCLKCVLRFFFEMNCLSLNLIFSYFFLTYFIMVLVHLFCLIKIFKLIFSFVYVMLIMDSEAKRSEMRVEFGRI